MLVTTDELISVALREPNSADGLARMLSAQRWLQA